MNPPSWLPMDHYVGQAHDIAWYRWVLRCGGVYLWVANDRWDSSQWDLVWLSDMGVGDAEGIVSWAKEALLDGVVICGQQFRKVSALSQPWKANQQGVREEIERAYRACVVRVPTGRRKIRL